MALSVPADWVSTYSAYAPPTSVWRASRACVGSRHERQRHGGVACERYAFSCMYWTANWQAWAEGQRCAAFGVDRAVESTTSCPSTIAAAGCAAGSGGATSRDLAGRPLGAVAARSEHSTRLVATASGGRANLDAR